MLGYDEELYFDEPESEDDIEHYGTPRHSGRYPWGSGKNPQQARDAISKETELKAKGLSEKERAVAMGYRTTSELRAALSQAKAARNADFDKAIKAQMHQNNNNVSAVARALGTNESTIRSRLAAMNKPTEERTSQALNSTMDILRSELNRHGEYIDVGKGSNLYIGVTPSRLETAVNALKNEGYSVVNVQYQKYNAAGGKSNLKVLCPKGTTENDVKYHMDKIHLLAESGQKVNLDGKKEKSMGDPISVDKKRIYVRYAEEGGADRDGTIELRPGVPDLNLGNSHYAQVRVLVDGNKYMKGMAHYSNKVPEGYDIIYNTNKTRDKEDKVFKEIDEKYMRDDVRPIDRFGAVITAQNKYVDKNGEEKQGVLNIMKEEGALNTYSSTLASQFLGKQTPALAKQQLALDYTKRAQDLEDIKSLTNNTLKQALLAPFADSCDAAAVDLKAAALPRQAWSFILPNPKLKDNEIYAPNFNNGERVVLIRYPHTGPFEIPELIVNNNSRSSKEIISNTAKDAVCVNKNVADKLSGADFDGDTVLVIPNNDGRIRAEKTLKGLEGFDTKAAYPPVKVYDKDKGEWVEGPKPCVTGNPKANEYNWQEQKHMGMVSNLITDMYLKGASNEELARAVKHSMVVIDVKKHNLDWKRSERENGIAELKKKYQEGGASTLLSRSSGDARGIPERKRAYNLKDENGNYIIKDGINVKTGEKEYQLTNRTYAQLDKKTGEWKRVPATITSTNMYEAKDARTLMSGPKHEGTEMERVYADYANKCKALGNEARKMLVNTPSDKRDPVAAKKYASEVSSLTVKLNEAQKRAPLERLANIKAKLYMESMLDATKMQLSKAEYKKEKDKALKRARRDVGASRYDIKITPKEWEAIQAHAVSPTTLRAIFEKTDLETLRKMAMPKTAPVLTDAKVARIKAYSNAGRTQAEIAESLGISVSTVREALKQ